MNRNFSEGWAIAGLGYILKNRKSGVLFVLPFVSKFSLKLIRIAKACEVALIGGPFSAELIGFDLVLPKRPLGRMDFCHLSTEAVYTEVGHSDMSLSHL
jgi:hypothetical protein